MGKSDPRPVEDDTLFNAFSVTKIFASVAVGVMLDQGSIAYYGACVVV
jgi:CubicO group peptidase (beta-lactamase class C family)